MVEVSPSIEMQLKVWSQAFAQDSLQLRRSRSNIGKEIDQHGRQLGVNHACALGDPQHTYRGFSRMKTARCANFGRVSVVMMACAKSCNSPAWSLPAPAASSGSVEIIFSTGSGTPIMPVEMEKPRWQRTPSSRRQLPANSLASLDPGFAGGAIGIARIHNHGANPAAAGRQRCAADLERRCYHPIFREHRRRGRARSRPRPAPDQAGRWP